MRKLILGTVFLAATTVGHAATAQSPDFDRRFHLADSVYWTFANTYDFQIVDGKVTLRDRRSNATLTAPVSSLRIEGTQTQRNGSAINLRCRKAGCVSEVSANGKQSYDSLQIVFDSAADLQAVLLPGPAPGYESVVAQVADTVAHSWGTTRKALAQLTQGATELAQRVYANATGAGRQPVASAANRAVPQPQKHAPATSAQRARSAPQTAAPKTQLDAQANE